MDFDSLSMVKISARLALPLLSSEKRPKRGGGVPLRYFYRVPCNEKNSLFPYENLTPISIPKLSVDPYSQSHVDVRKAHNHPSLILS